MWTGCRTSADGGLRMAVARNDDTDQFTVIWSAGNVIVHDEMPEVVVAAIQKAVTWRGQR